MKAQGHLIMVDGIKVGTSTALTVPSSGKIQINLRFKPYWPGLFHLMALLADQHHPDQGHDAGERGHSAGS